MTKQEEIREGMYSLGFMPEHFQSYETGGTISLGYKAVKKILSYLHSQGVVIKVTQEYPNLPHFIYEPLIEEAKDVKDKG